MVLCAYDSRRRPFDEDEVILKNVSFRPWVETITIEVPPQTGYGRSELASPPARTSTHLERLRPDSRASGSELKSPRAAVLASNQRLADNSHCATELDWEEILEAVQASPEVDRTQMVHTAPVLHKAREDAKRNWLQNAIVEAQQSALEIRKLAADIM
eukprot:gnl/MRDRNA2_/MRDRNA2_34996_c0_seq1.p1 gnl/MRDRNA2_/MRDRNA2_34996_c0~~gnl/MRDRNA2_/MRDRNA2_34996_c0_seq1.p1  ORF type:complete len:158 (-),score=27.64 gnl/MRDRNA2_/MRDRNA2_34996_c0_seq1:9-482(-)